MINGLNSAYQFLLFEGNCMMLSAHVLEVDIAHCRYTMFQFSTMIIKIEGAYRKLVLDLVLELFKILAFIHHPC